MSASLHARILGSLILLSGTVNAADSAIHTLYLVRHGAYLPDARADPQKGPGLSTLGITQARLIATRLRSMPIAVDSVTSSALTRAQQTAAIVHEQVSDAAASASPALSECTPPARGIRSDDANALACKQRLDAVFATYFKATAQPRHDVLVCHGNVIRYLVTKALGTDTTTWPTLSVAHASLSIVEIHPNGAIRIAAVGDAGHIPANLQSWGDDADPNLVAPELGPFSNPK